MKLYTIRHPHRGEGSQGSSTQAPQNDDPLSGYILMDKNVYEFISKKSNDPIIEWRTCRVSGKQFAIYESDSKFYKKIGPLYGGQKFSVPLPTLCPEERMRRRLAWRNERTLYERKCDWSGGKIVSMYNPTSPYKVYDQKIWWSDVWDARDYGVDVDFNTSLVSQFDMLMKSVPHSALNGANNQENSVYTNYSVANKNTYLSFGPTENDTCMYGKFINSCTQSYDCLSTYNCQWCYEGVDSHGCYQCQYFIDCSSCQNCLMIENCSNCKDCIGCVGLVGKEYYYLNKQVSKEEFDTIKKSFYPINNASLCRLEKLFSPEKAQAIYPSANIQTCDNVSGDMLVNCHNCQFCFDLVDQEDCKYCRYGKKGRGSYDCVFTDPSGMFDSYEVCSSLSSHCCSVFFCLDCSHVYWSVECHNSHHLLGCVGLRDKEYCIFNKQYSKDEYEKLAVKVLEKMTGEDLRGEYMPASISPYAYNETVAQEYFPLTQQETLSRGWRWLDKKPSVNLPENAKVIQGNELPDDIGSVGEDILGKIISCRRSQRPFRIMKAELDFYRKSNISLPQLHPDERHRDRLSRKPSKSLHLRKCDKTHEEILSIYPNNSPFKVFGQSAYIQKIHG